VLSGLPLDSHPDLLSGLENSEDAGVYRLRDDLAIVQTVDYFTPVVDDPYLFGQIAAANSLSDVYAMGGRPITALNVVCYPMKRLGAAVLREILEGGLDKIHEVGAVLVGGHSVDDEELKYGLSVIGTVHPDRIVRNSGARPGDVLVLTKPIGTAIVSTALKQGKASPEAVDRMIAAMVETNRLASERMLEAGANACTDITGFGLLGHAAEMAAGSGTALRIESERVPRFPEAIPYLEEGCLCGGTKRNRAHFGERVDFEPGIPENVRYLLFDAQTSGGLLVSVPAASAEEMIAALRRDGVASAERIGDVLEGPAGRIRVE
jgi:selenide,water dikinase